MLPTFDEKVLILSVILSTETLLMFIVVMVDGESSRARVD